MNLIGSSGTRGWFPNYKFIYLFIEILTMMYLIPTIVNPLRNQVVCPLCSLSFVYVQDIFQEEGQAVRMES